METSALSSVSEELGRIISTALHQVDVDGRELKQINISNQDTDLEVYLSDLLYEISGKSQKRSYEFHRDTTEFNVTLCSYYDNSDLSKNENSTNLANRLLEKEIDADNRYGHLGSAGKGHVKKGSFLQFIYKDGGGISYLGVKIEHQTFIDEKDFKKKIGLAVANKMYKACKVSFSKTGSPSDVFVYDTNAKPSVYWWKDFLELREARGDALNTKRASSEVIKEINKIKKYHLADYTILRNSAVAAFKQKGQMKYDEFLENTFLNYDPVDPELNSRLQNMIERLRSLPERKGFDTQFTLVPAEVPFRSLKVSLSREISLSIAEGVENLDDKIWSEKTASGKKLVVIESPSGFNRFKLKERV